MNNFLETRTIVDNKDAIAIIRSTELSIQIKAQEDGSLSIMDKHGSYIATIGKNDMTVYPLNKTIKEFQP